MRSVDMLAKFLLIAANQLQRWFSAHLLIPLQQGGACQGEPNQAGADKRVYADGVTMDAEGVMHKESQKSCRRRGSHEG